MNKTSYNALVKYLFLNLRATVKLSKQKHSKVQWYKSSLNWLKSLTNDMGKNKLYIPYNQDEAKIVHDLVLKLEDYRKEYFNNSNNIFNPFMMQSVIISHILNEVQDNHFIEKYPTMIKNDYTTSLENDKLTRKMIFNHHRFFTKILEEVL